MEAQVPDHSGSLRIMAVVLASIVAAAVPGFVAAMLHTSEGTARNAFPTRLLVESLHC